MATLSEIKISFEQRIAANYSTTIVKYDNTELKDIGNNAWVRATMIPTATENASIGVSKRYNGIFWFQVFVPLSIGTELAYQIIEELEALFSNVEFDEVVCYASETVRMGNEGKGWFRMDLRSPFWSHELY